jgi:UrcA family protein
MKRFSIAAAVFTAALFVPALAGEASVVVQGLAPTSAGGYQIKTVKVAFADLDISTGQGAAALLDRIQTASRIVCGERNGTLMNAERVKEFAACQTHATKIAVRTIGAPSLVQVATQR